MKGFVENIKGMAVRHGAFRQVLYTAKNCQLVLMVLKLKEEIGAEGTSSISSSAWKKVQAKPFLTVFAW